MSVKYSIIVPVFNGMPYLETALSTILSSAFNNFEVIVSDDNSSDGSGEYLQSISDPRIKIFRAPYEMSLSEHWEWALSHASGEWVMFVGQDDGIQKYFFELADILTSEAVSKGIRSIAARRAYIFWPGCEDQYQSRVHFYAWRHTSVRNFRPEILRALFFGRSYHELPQMYSNSLFHKDLLDQARLLQDGKVFVSHPQDANLAAVAALLESRYLRSEIPLGWVGTSPSSAGLAIATVQASKDESINDDLARAYANKVAESEIEYLEKAGDFAFGETPVYFWQSLVRVSSAQSSSRSRFFSSKVVLLMLFTGTWSRILSPTQRRRKLDEFARILELNGLKLKPIQVIAFVMRVFIRLRVFLMNFAAKLITQFGQIQSRDIVGFHISAQEESNLELAVVNSRAEQLARKLLR